LVVTAERTPLHDEHVRLGAQMTNFGGWVMPLQYTSIRGEHSAVREAVGLFDLSHMGELRVIDERLAQRVVTRDLARLQTGRIQYALLCNEEGGIIDDVLVYAVAEGGYLLVVNAGNQDGDFEWMQAQGEGPVLNVGRDWALVGVQGPHAVGLVQRLTNSQLGGVKYYRFIEGTVADVACVISRTGYTGEDGFEVMLPSTRVVEFWQALAAAGVRPCGLGARDTLRLEAGMNLYGQDMDETVNPVESGLAWTVDLASARDFVGKAALLARTPTRQLIGVLLEDKGGVLRAHQKVMTRAGEGEITSGTFSPTLGASIALARLPAGVGAGERAQVQVRGKALAARIVKPPFVRHGKSLLASIKEKPL